ncbi:hypothetical protein [Saccharicrinis sp. FJH54]|uniref:hypothetical protein n=1 Tax=Saccharicrinis sp. FJH54 TaxID=3344665 RepID=UPI0035D51B5D
MKKIMILLYVCLNLYSCSSNKTKEKKTEIASPKQERSGFTLNITENIDSSPKEIPDPFADKKLELTDDSTANLIINQYNKLISADSSNLDSLELEFFNSFPDSFDEYYKLFGYKDDHAMPLYGEMSIIFKFYGLSNIDKVKLYNKYLDIAKNGHWEADAIQDFGIDDKLKNDTKIMCSVLSQRSDNEIKSILYFVYDGPHPEDPGALDDYNSTLSKVKTENVRIAKLMEETYNGLLKKVDGHGH